MMKFRSYFRLLLVGIGWAFVTIPISTADSGNQSLAVATPNCNNPLHCIQSQECLSPSSLMTENIQEIEKTLVAANKLLEPEAEPNVLVLAEKKLYSIDPEVRLSAIRELQVLFDTKGNSVPFEIKQRVGLRLTHLVYSDPSTDLRTIASQMIGSFRDPALLKVMIPLVSVRPPRELAKYFSPMDEATRKKIRQFVVQGIQKLDPEKLKQDLYLKTFLEEESKNNNLLTLQTQSQGLLKPKDLVLLWNQYLQKASNDENGTLSESAILIQSKLFSLDSIDDPDGVLQKQLLPTLIEKANKHMNPSVRITAIQLLSSLPRSYDHLKKIVSVLTKRLTVDPSIKVKIFAVNLLGQLRAGAGISLSKEILGGLTSTLFEEGQNKELKTAAISSLIRASRAPQTEDGYQALLSVFLNSKRIFSDLSEDVVKSLWEDMEGQYFPLNSKTTNWEMIPFYKTLSDRKNNITVSKQIADLAAETLKNFKDSKMSLANVSREGDDSPDSPLPVTTDYPGVENRGGIWGGWGYYPGGGGLGVDGGGLSTVPTVQNYSDVLEQAIAKVNELFPNNLVELENNSMNKHWENYSTLSFYVNVLSQVASGMSVDQKALVMQPYYQDRLRRITEKLEQINEKLNIQRLPGGGIGVGTGRAF